MHHSQIVVIIVTRCTNLHTKSGYLFVGMKRPDLHLSCCDMLSCAEVCYNQCVVFAASVLATQSALTHTYQLQRGRILILIPTSVTTQLQTGTSSPRFPSCSSGCYSRTAATLKPCDIRSVMFSLVFSSLSCTAEQGFRGNKRLLQVYVPPHTENCSTNLPT